MTSILIRIFVLNPFSDLIDSVNSIEAPNPDHDTKAVLDFVFCLGRFMLALLVLMTLIIMLAFGFLNLLAGHGARIFTGAIGVYLIYCVLTYSAKRLWSAASGVGQDWDPPADV